MRPYTNYYQERETFLMRKQSEREDASHGSEDAAPTRGRKPYRAPRLAVYGDLHRIALAKHGTAGDGMGVPATKITDK